MDNMVLRMEYLIYMLYGILIIMLLFIMQMEEAVLLNLKLLLMVKVLLFMLILIQEKAISLLVGQQEVMARMISVIGQDGVVPGLM